MKRILLTLFSLALFTPAFAAWIGDLSYSTNDNGTITIRDCNDYASGELIIPATIDGKKVTEIGNYAFEDCESLTSVTIPEGVTEIGGRAFRDCSSLTSVTIPKGVTSIGEGAFRGCWSLTSITIPEGVTSIGERAFYDCSSLTSVIIPEGVTVIGEDAFSGCDSLTSVTIPSSVTKIGKGAFLGVAPIQLTAAALFGGMRGENLTSVTIPKGVTKIGDWAFFYCRSLTSVTIPEGVTKIGEGAFVGCSRLTSVTIPSSVTSIWGGAFSGVAPIQLTAAALFGGMRGENLTSVTIPEGVTEIGYRAFVGCSSLTSVTIPEGVTEIRAGAFLECTAMKKMIFNGPPPNVEPLSEEEKQILKREGISNPETLPATKGYYLPEHAEAWEKVLGGETGRWNNLQMEPIPEEMLAQLKAAEAQEDTVNPSKGITQSASSPILWFVLGMLGSFIIGVIATVFILKKKKAVEKRG